MERYGSIIKVIPKKLQEYKKLHSDVWPEILKRIKEYNDILTQKWWEVCKPCQTPIKSAADDEWWADMEEVFH